MGTDNFWGGMVEGALGQVPNMQCIVVENRDAESAEVFRDLVQARGVKGVHQILGQPLQVSSTKIRKMCNSNDTEGLKGCLGIPRVSDYIIENRLFKDKLCEMDPMVFADFKDLGYQYPITAKMRDDFQSKFLDSNENLENLLRHSKLIS